MEIKDLISNPSPLFEKIGDFARKAGRVTTRPLLLLYFVLKSKDTPASDKLIIVSTLAYVVLPVDLISAKRFPIIGWIDEVASVAAAIEKVGKYITPEIEMQTDDQLNKWFGTEYEVITTVD